MLLPDTRLDSSTDLLAEVSEGKVTDMGVATHGATEGQSVADEVWTFRKLPATGGKNVEQMLGGQIDNAILYGTVSLHLPREQETTMYVGSHDDLKVWLNGALIYESFGYHESYDYMDFLPVTLRQGRNVLLVAVQARLNGFFGFEPGTEYTVANTGCRLHFFLRHQFIRVIPLRLIFAQKMSPIWRGGSLILPSTLPSLRPST